MRRIINGKVYDTDTAREVRIAEFPPHAHVFEKKTGEFFIYDTSQDILYPLNPDNVFLHSHIERLKEISSYQKRTNLKISIPMEVYLALAKERTRQQRSMSSIISDLVRENLIP